MGITARGTYRVWQVWQALRAGPLDEEARRDVTRVLTEEQFVLFARQSQAGQQHGYRVMRSLADAGHEQQDLLVAALLHDVGKNRVRYSWLDRTIVVLAQRFAPGLAERWSAGGPATGGPADYEPAGWTRAFVVKAAHPDWGAEALAACGGSELSVALVRRHQETMLAPWEDNEENRLLVLLQWADDQN